ncbi:hypothetical protein [Legionella steigerwaltii]|uniref:hypothetical protein n=1 Tax=Legionella steigerwaltii TaxID=460 RepID=UPI0010551DC2|nr:hypothetical protein [Legionella steigerwaltii]
MKEFFPRKARSTEFLSTATSEKENFNHFINIMKIPAGQAIVENGKLIMPFFTGKEPSWEEIQEYLLKMYKSGFVMADPKPNNFMHTQYGLMPIDYGAVFDINDPVFMKNLLARNFTVDAVLTYSKAFKAGTGLAEAYNKLHSDELIVLDDEDDEEESIVLTLPAFFTKLSVQSTAQPTLVIGDVTQKKSDSSSPHSFFKSPSSEPASAPASQLAISTK